MLDHVIGDPLPLFQGEDWVIKERRLAWLYRIELLREIEQTHRGPRLGVPRSRNDPEQRGCQSQSKNASKETLACFRVKSSAGQWPSKAPAPSHSIWRGVAGMRDLKAMLERDVVLPLQEPEIYARYRLGLPNGILLYGPPGCGKTFIARKLAEVAGFNFMEVTPGDIASIYVHGTQGKVANSSPKPGSKPRA